MNLDRAIGQWERRQQRAAAKKNETVRAQKAWLELSARVRQRDGNACRICTCQTTRFGVGDPRLNGMAHHIVFRSAGGGDDLSNLVWVCWACHDAIHRHEIDVTGTAEALTVTRRTP